MSQLDNCQSQTLIRARKAEGERCIGWGKGKWRKVDSESKAEIGKEMQTEDGRFSRHVRRGGADRCSGVDLDTNKH